MSSVAASVPNPPKRKFVALWRAYDQVRVEQRARLEGLVAVGGLQAGDHYGQLAWEMARMLWRQLPSHVRIDLPSPRCFGRLLGLFRTCLTISGRTIPVLELSAREIGKLVGYEKSQVEAALRWLGRGPIEYKGERYGHGIGVLHRARRTGPGIVHGVSRMIYRTSRTGLTEFGKVLMGLARDLQSGRRRRDRGPARPAAPIQHRRRPSSAELQPQPRVSPSSVDEAPPPTGPPGGSKEWFHHLRTTLLK